MNFYLLLILLIMQISFVGCTSNFKERSSGTLRIFLARHGQTDWNVERRLQGGNDIELNNNGREQAKKLAEMLGNVEIDQIYCSGLRRSRETAEIVAGKIPVESLPGLNEQSFGSF